MAALNNSSNTTFSQSVASTTNEEETTEPRTSEIGKEMKSDIKLNLHKHVHQYILFRRKIRDTVPSLVIAENSSTIPRIVTEHTSYLIQRFLISLNK